MKKIIITTIICVLTSLTLFGQTTKRTYKKFTDTDFKVGDIILSPSILFDLSRCSVRPESKDSVKIIVGFLKQHPTYKIEIGVHTDTRGTDEMNSNISKCRAKELAIFINQVFNIPTDNIISKGYGESDLLIDDTEINNATDKIEEEQLHQRNRRVEIKILGT